MITKNLIQSIKKLYCNFKLFLSYKEHDDIATLSISLVEKFEYGEGLLLNFNFAFNNDETHQMDIEKISSEVIKYCNCVPVTDLLKKISSVNSKRNEITFKTLVVNYYLGE